MRVALLLLVFFIHAVNLLAQEQRNGQNDDEDTTFTDITIHGAMIDKPLKDAPTSATILSAATVAEHGDQSLQNTMELVPNLNWAGGSNRPRFLQIRGIGELEQYEGAPNPSVGLFIDDIDFSGFGAPISLFDVDQVEVLRGPQGTRYGANALAGMVNVKSVDPAPYNAMRGEFMLGSDDLVAGGVAVGGSMAGTDNKLQFRIMSYGNYSNGFRDNTFLGEDDTNKRAESTTRLKVRAIPTNDLQVDLTLLFINADNGYDIFTIDNNFLTESDRPGKDAQTSGGSALKVTKKLNSDFELKWITTMLRASQDYSFDGDWGNNDFWAPYLPYDYFSANNRDRLMISQEYRLAYQPANYVHGRDYRAVIGLYTQKLGEDTATDQFSENVVYDSLNSNYDQNTEAVFSENEFPLFTATSLVLSGRVENRNASYSDSRDSDFDPNDVMIGGSVALNHDLDNKTRAYILVARGYKGGGFNTGVNVPEDVRIYDPEYLWNFEVGIKGSWFEKTLDVTLATFYQARQDLQLQFSYQNDPSDPLSFTYITDNAASGYNTGLELESVWQATDETTIKLISGLLMTEFTDVDVEGSSLNGREQAHAPNWQYLASLREQLTNEIFATVEIVGKDAFYFDNINNERSDAYHLVNFNIGYSENQWSVKFWINNALDERYAVRGFYFGNEPPDYPEKLYTQLGDPRQIGVTFGYYF